MPLIRTTDVDTPELLARAYRLGQVIAWNAATGGSAGQIFKLVTTSGSYAAKEFLTQRPAAHDLERALAFASICRAAAVPNPETLRAGDGAALVEHPGTGRPWLVQRWVDGVPPERTDQATALWLADQAATIHQLAVPSAPEDDHLAFFTRATSGWAELADGAGQAAVTWADRLARRAGEFERLTALVNAVPVGAVITCHRDLKATNTLLNGDGARWLLDWDSSGPQEPWRELGTLLLHHVGHDDAVAAIAAAYRQAGGGPLPAGVELFATGLAVWLNFLRSRVLAALDPGADTRDRMGAATTAASLVDGIPGLNALTAAARAAAA